MALSSTERSWKFRGIVGMSESLYQKMLAEQGGKCYLCQATPKNKRLAVDHNHLTGQARRLLCNLCNHAIERMEKVLHWESRAREYLGEFI